MCKRGDIVALEQYHTASYVGGQHTQHVEFTLATATSVSRDGAVKAVRLAGFPYDRNSKFQAHKVAHMFRTKVLTISPEHQRNAARAYAATI